MARTDKAGHGPVGRRCWRMRDVDKDVCTTCGRVRGVQCRNSKGQIVSPHLIRITREEGSDAPLTQRDISDYLP